MIVEVCLMLGGAVLAAGGVYQYKRRCRDRKARDTLPQFFRNCRKHIQDMRVRAIGIRNDHKDPGFAQTIEALCNAYDRILKELEENPMDIMQTGAVEHRLERLSQSLQDWIALAVKARANSALRPSLDRTKGEFRTILAEVEKTLQDLQAKDQLDHKVRMQVLLRIIVPELFKDKGNSPASGR